MMTDREKRGELRRFAQREDKIWVKGYIAMVIITALGFLGACFV